jgi:Cu/Ag efflux pump CusA
LAAPCRWNRLVVGGNTTIPIMWSTGAGSEVMRRIAAPMVGGMISSTLLTLIVIPAIYALTQERIRRAAPDGQ